LVRTERHARILPEVRASAAILMGGRGERLGGVDKAALRIGGRPLLDRQLEVLVPCFAEVLLVGGTTTGRTPDATRAVPDERPGHGPLGGLEAALTVATYDEVTIFGCDLPFLDPRLVAALRDHPAAEAVVPRALGRAQPLHARYARAILPRVRARVDRGELALLALLEELDVVYLDEPQLRAIDPTLRGLTNVNTPADLAKADREALVHRR
jgi:molybdopterin-guanine dinucleotide biosynthesis protein A